MGCPALPAFLALCVAVVALGADDATSHPSTVLDFTLKDIDGKNVDLTRYSGKVVLLVNVASKCGYTPQYEQLERLYRKYKERGLVIAAFPANEFGGQEPGANAQIKEFCTSRYDVTFDLFSKIVVKGENIHPLYAFLTSRQSNGDFGGEIKWNFTKFLVSRDARVVARFEPKDKPDDKAVIDAIERELDKTR